jgi:hypothetical protein
LTNTLLGLAFYLTLTHAKYNAEDADEKGFNYGGLGIITLFEIADALFYYRDHVASTLMRYAMSFVDDLAGLPLKFLFGGQGELHALVLPLKNTHGEALFLLSYKVHAVHSDSKVS